MGSELVEARRKDGVHRHPNNKHSPLNLDVPLLRATPEGLSMDQLTGDLGSPARAQARYLPIKT